MVKKTNFVKLYKILYKLTAFNYRKTLKSYVNDINKFDDRQVFELMHALNTDVDLKKITNPKLSAKQMRQIRLDEEFSVELVNAFYDEDVLNNRF